MQHNTHFHLTVQTLKYAWSSKRVRREWQYLFIALAFPHGASLALAHPWVLQCTLLLYMYNLNNNLLVHFFFGLFLFLPEKTHRWHDGPSGSVTNCMNSTEQTF